MGNVMGTFHWSPRCTKGRGSGGLSSQKIKWFCLACTWSVIRCQFQAVGLPPNIATKNPRGATVLQKVPVNRFLIYDKDREINGWWIEDFRCLPSCCSVLQSELTDPLVFLVAQAPRSLPEQALWGLCWLRESPRCHTPAMCNPSEDHGAALRCAGWGDTLEGHFGHGLRRRWLGVSHWENAFHASWTMWRRSIYVVSGGV